MKQTIKAMVTIAERGHGNDIAALYAQKKVSCHYHCVGRGTASSELLDLFGFGTAERDILLSLAPGREIDLLLQELRDVWRTRVPTRGIAFSLPVRAMNNLVAAALLQGQEQLPEKEGREASMEEKKEKRFSLILAAVDQGFTDDVMNTAREAGARGGTILRARWAGGKSVEQFYGITLQSEKEILAIVASEEQMPAIMKAINQKHGLRSEAHGTLCVLPVDEVVRLG